MYAHQALFRLSTIAVAAICCASFSARAAESAIPTGTGTETGAPAQPGAAQPAAPSPNNEKFKQLRTQCDTDVPSGKANGNICVDAAMLLMGDPQLSSDIPDEFRDMKEDQRIKIALRLLERGVDSSNRARAIAYDWYNKVGFLGMSPYADPYRAAELMDMMIKSGYSGGILRKIRTTTSIIAFGSSDTEKKEGCATAKKMLAEGKLDADSTSIAKEVLGTVVCTGFEQQPAK